MNIKSITIEGFKSIYKETTINFDSSGLWKVSGDVGAGKTTLGECILFCLYGNVKDKNIKDLISWGLKKCTSSIELESRGHEIIINRLIRTKGQGSLEIFIDGQLLEYTNKRGGQQILEEDYFDISKTAVETLCIISFNNFKSIIHMSSGSAETRKFIDDVFGFNIVNKYIDNAKTHLATATAEFNELASSISTLESQKTKYELARENIESNVDVDKINEYSNEIIKCKNQLSALERQYKVQSEILIKNRDSLNKELITIKEKGRAIRDIINKLQNGVCPLCGGIVSKESIEEYERDRQTLLDSYKEKQELYNNIVSELKTLTDEYNTNSKSINNNIYKFQSEISKVNLQQKLLANNYDKLIKDIEGTIEEKNASKILLESDVQQWQELYDKLYKESRPTLLRHYIPTLNKNINYYLQELSQPYIITFDESFSCSISAYGNDNIPISSLSTGQSKLVDTAVILGVIKTLLNGINLNVTIFDELLSNCHSDLREVVCNILKKETNNKTIFVISHADINDDFFDGVIKAKLIKWEDEEGKLIQHTNYKIEKFK